MKDRTIFSIIILLSTLMVNNFASEHQIQAATPSVALSNDRFLLDAPNIHATNFIAMNELVASRIPSFSKAETSIRPNWSNLFVDTSISKITVSTKTKDTPVVTKGLLPQANHNYTYFPSFEGEEQKTYVASVNPYVSNAIDLFENEWTGYTYIESENSFNFGVGYSDVFFFSLSYPMKEKTTTIDTDYGFESNNKIEVKVNSTSTTLTTEAGTFENVVVLNYPNGSTLYLAKGYGIIRITDFEGNITTELIAVK